MSDEGEIWREVFGALAETQAKQAEGLGATQQAISQKVRAVRRTAPTTRWALALAAAALREGPRGRARIIARARGIFESEL